MRSFCTVLSFLLCSQSALSFAPTIPTTTTLLTKLHATTTTSEVGTTTSTTSVVSIPKYYDFKGHKCYAETTRPAAANNADATPSWFPLAVPASPKKPQVVLIHGFGCSTVYWRETTNYLTSAGYTVHAVDLLGQGKSAKPGRADGIEYSTKLWAEMVQTYIASTNDIDSFVVMGNSLGSCVALTVAVNTPTKVSGVGMYNCGVGMNSRNLLKDESLSPLQVVLFTALFDVLDFAIFDNVPLLTYLLERVVTKELLRNALTGLYAYAEDASIRVDDVLVDSFYLPAQDEGSVEALNQIYTNDAGKSPMELHKENVDLFQSLPMHLVWGTQDQVTPLEGPVGQFYKKLADDESSPVTLSTLEAGHIPFDEVPECNESMVRWLEETVVGGGSASSSDNAKPGFLSWL